MDYLRERLAQGRYPCQDNHGIDKGWNNGLVSGRGFHGKLARAVGLNEQGDGQVIRQPQQTLQDRRCQTGQAARAIGRTADNTHPLDLAGMQTIDLVWRFNDDMPVAELRLLHG